MPGKLFKFSSRPKRLHDFQIIVKQMNSKTKNSFINRISNRWNMLPKELANITDQEIFKSKISQYLKTLKESEI